MNLSSTRKFYGYSRAKSYLKKPNKFELLIAIYVRIINIYNKYNYL